jgi:Bifunctional DNA primase/polymerase, N-terminal
MGGILLDWALIYKDMGLCPIPLYRRDDPRDESGNKRPMIAGWQNVRLPDDATLECWFCDDRRNIGMVCGRVSGNLIVVDFDDMGAYFDWLESADPPTTLTIDTGGGGVHCYYRLSGEAPGNHKLIGGDLRGQGGQVVAPPSVHLSGRRYGLRDESPIALASLDMLKLPYLIRPSLSAPARQALAVGDPEPIIQALAGAQEGDRNNTLLWCACRLFDQGMGLSQVESTLMLTALQIGLGRREIKTTIHNAEKQSRKARPPLQPHQLLAARLERHGAPHYRPRYTVRRLSI